MRYIFPSLVICLGLVIYYFNKNLSADILLVIGVPIQFLLFNAFYSYKHYISLNITEIDSNSISNFIKYRSMFNKTWWLNLVALLNAFFSDPLLLGVVTTVTSSLMLIFGIKDSQEINTISRGDIKITKTGTKITDTTKGV